MAEENSWRTPAFRQSVVQKIDEAIRTSGMATSRNSMEMENHVFQKARSKEEYLGFVARLILHVREMSTKKTGINGPNQGGPGMPDPINALQNLASQGSRNSQMMGSMNSTQSPQMGGPQQVGPQNATNLLQTLNRGPAPGMGNLPVGMQGNINSTMQPNMSQITGQMGGNMPVGMQGTMSGMQPGGPGQGMQSGPGGMAVMQPGMQPGMQAGMQQPLPNRSPMGGVGPSGPSGVNGSPITMQQQQMQQQMQQQQQQGNPNMMPSPLVNQLQSQQQVQQMHQQGQNQMQQAMQQQQQGGGGNMMQAGGAFCGVGPMQSMQQSMQVGPGIQQQQMANQMMINQQRKTCDPTLMVTQGPGGMLMAGPGQVGIQQSSGTAVGPPSGVVPNVFPRNVTPTQFLVQSPTPSTQQVQSPASSGPSGGGPPMPMPPTIVGGPQQQHQQMIPSPALAPSPGGAGSGIVMTPGQQSQRSVGGMAPSPSNSLNTPGQPGQSPMQDEQAYREKVRQLSKYIEPLRKMIARMGNEGEHMEKTSKMKKLLEILSNPSQRMPLETLLKCEVVLEKLDFKRGDGSVPSASGQLTIKEQHAFNPLIEAVSNCLQSNVSNHTLHRTFGPPLEALFCPEIKLLPPLKRKRALSPTPTSTIPDVLQGEIARLDTRFKVSLDPAQQSHQVSNNNGSSGGSKTIQLICWLDDKHLPCVPPVSLTVPQDYPLTSPKCHMAAHEYGATHFLSAVQAALMARIKKLPRYFSVSQLLDTWEMSVRQASAPNTVPVSATTLLMGL